MKKSVVTLTLLVLFTGTIFYIGWIQFAVPAGKYGVLVSKTGGVDPQPVLPAQFRWQWEKLIPTNCQVIVFDLVPVTRKVSVEGILPSGLLYSGMFEGNPDFTWKIDLNITAQAAASKLPELVGTFHIRDQAALDAWTNAKIERITDEACLPVLTELLNSPVRYAELTADPSLFAGTINANISKLNQADLDIISTTVEKSRIPDFTLYLLAQKTYTDYQQRRAALISETAATEARDSVSEYLQIERFARWGEVLTKYPILIDFLAVARDDAGETFKAVKALRQPVK